MKETVQEEVRRQKTLKHDLKETDEKLHPSYTDREDAHFIRELYRLRGFALLRNQ